MAELFYQKRKGYENRKEDHLETRFRSISALLSGAVVIIGIVVLFGWLFDIAILKSISSHWVSMKANTALCFLLAGISISLQNQISGQVNPAYKKTLSVSAAVLFSLIAALTLAEYLFKINLGIDELIFKDDPNPVGTLYPGRMVPVSVVCFLLMGLSNLLCIYKKFKFSIFQFPVLIVGIISLVGLAGYVFDSEEMFSIGEHNSMAFHTVLCFLLLSVALIFSQPQVGLMKIVSSDTLGGMVIRKTLPFAIVLLFLLCWLHLQGELMGTYNSKSGIGILLISFVIIFTITLYLTASSLTKFEGELLTKTTELQHSLKEISDYKLAIDQSSIVSITNLEGNIIFVNENFVGVSKFSKEELIGQNHRILNSGHHSKEFFHNLLTTILSGKVWRNDIKNKTKDGTFYWVDTTIVPFIDKDGKTYQYVEIGKDITERKKAEKALLHNELRLKQAQEIAHLGSWEADFATNTVIFSDEACRIYGFLPEENKQSLESWMATVYPEDLDYVQKEVEKSNASLSDTSLNHRIICRDGTVKYIYAVVKFILNREGKPIGIYGTAHDITERKNAEKDKEKLISELSNKNNELMQFNYIVSHNLRSPIANLLGLCDYFTLPNRSEEDDLKTVKYILHSVNKMDDLIKDLNSILSLRSAINTHKENISIPSIIQNISDTLQKEIAETNCIIKTIIPEDASEIYIVKSYIESIFYNLISNAIKYHADDRKPQIIISVKREGNKMLISVSDNGIGIDLANQGKDVFGLYKRFHFAVEGKGLGLHLVKTQVEALGGTIKIESEVNKGTTFHVTLPHD